MAELAAGGGGCRTLRRDAAQLLLVRLAQLLVLDLVLVLVLLVHPLQCPSMLFLLLTPPLLPQRGLLLLLLLQRRQELLPQLLHLHLLLPLLQQCLQPCHARCVLALECVVLRRRRCQLRIHAGRLACVQRVAFRLQQPHLPQHPAQPHHQYVRGAPAGAAAAAAAIDVTTGRASGPRAIMPLCSKAGPAWTLGVCMTVGTRVPLMEANVSASIGLNTDAGAGAGSRPVMDPDVGAGSSALSGRHRRVDRRKGRWAGMRLTAACVHAAVHRAARMRRRRRTHASWQKMFCDPPAAARRQQSRLAAGSGRTAAAVTTALQRRAPRTQQHWHHH
eukprot:365953-Chlamydomonas_euryale.AAC.1